ncbi:MAG TPA: hypothetical protein PK624_13625 [Spirochaetota bacterium]|nr:hypothetical protein [Spirochaetota bacterium]HOR45827.1 hypothetical protein [Spirochaetota bacterium]HPK57533.1 hypothetical protein [Spirochaetota bacterium]
MAQKQFKTKSIQPMNPSQLRMSVELEEVQHLMPMSADDRDRLRKDIEKSGEIRDAIKVYYDKDDNCCILGGYNRWQIALELGWSTVPVEIMNMPAEERRMFVVMDNLARRHLTREQKTKIVEMFLKETPAVSDRTIAKKVGVDHKTVSAVRGKMVSTGEIPQLEKREGADGKTRKTERTIVPPAPIISKKKEPVKKESDIIKEAVGDMKFSIKSSLNSVPKDLRAKVVKELIQYLKGI